MREFDVKKITEAVKRLSMETNYFLGEDMVKALKASLDKEESPVGKSVLGQIIENQEIARTEQMAICQDTGFTVVFIDLGQDVHLTGGDLTEAVNEGVRQGYQEGYLRKSIVKDPLHRVNTGDNTPAVIHLRIVPGEKVHLTVAPKGGGSENMSEVQMLKPADGPEGVKNFVIDRVRRSGGNPCPPIVVGVGIGGTYETAALIAKRALLRELGQFNPDPYYAEMEKELLRAINRLGIGPMGLGGRVTALGVFIETYPCHIASLPIAVNIQCHAARHKSVVI
ncbi:L(+)-tartrate dehydratase subunit alpha [bacterium BMS3Bbin03]|nr:L(+)-tartrate dehydratase subunit alpha [bacterium BMS3Bbin03]HDZ12481.1 fumarate hydratase [Bacteroidota bacterium]